MPIAGGSTSPTTDVRTIEAGALLIGLGAILLLVSLFLEWYQPGLDAWVVFEVWDLVLALLAVGALVAIGGRLGYGAPRPDSWLIATAGAALVIVVYAILDPPPATAGLPDGDPATGLWLALLGSVLMTAGAVLSVARISVAISAAGPAPRDRAVAATHDPAVTKPARRRGGLFSRGVPDAADEPVEPVAPSSTAVPPTEPTRRM